MNVTLFKLANYRLPAGLPLGFSASGDNSGLTFLRSFITSWGPETVFRLQGTWKEVPLIKRLSPNAFVLAADVLFDGQLVVTDAPLDAPAVESALSAPSTLLQDFLFFSGDVWTDNSIAGEVYRGAILPLPTWNDASVYSRGSQIVDIGDRSFSSDLKVALPSTSGGDIAWGDVSAFSMPNLSWLGTGLAGLIAVRLVPTIGNPFESIVLSSVMPATMAADLPVPNLTSRYGKFDLRFSRVYSCSMQSGTPTVRAVENASAADLGTTTRAIQDAISTVPSLGAVYVSSTILDYNLAVQVLDTKAKLSLSLVSGGFSHAGWPDPFTVNLRGRDIPPCQWTFPAIYLRLYRHDGRWDMTLAFACPLPVSDSVIQYKFGEDAEFWDNLELNSAYPRVISKSWTSTWPNFKIGMGTLDDPDCILDFTFD